MCLRDVKVAATAGCMVGGIINQASRVSSMDPFSLASVGTRGLAGVEGAGWP